MRFNLKLLLLAIVVNCTIAFSQTPPNVTIISPAGSTDVPLSGTFTLGIDNGFEFDSTAIYEGYFEKSNDYFSWLTQDSIVSYVHDSVPIDTITSGKHKLSFFVITKSEYDSSDYNRDFMNMDGYSFIDDSTLTIQYTGLTKDTEYIFVVDSLSVYDPDNSVWHTITNETYTFKTVSWLPRLEYVSIIDNSYLSYGDTITTIFNSDVDSLSYSGDNIIDVKLLDSIDALGVEYFSNCSITQWKDSTNREIYTVVDSTLIGKELYLDIDISPLRGDSLLNEQITFRHKLLDYALFDARDGSGDKLDLNAAFGYSQQELKYLQFNDTLSITANSEVGDLVFSHYKIYSDARDASNYTVDSSNVTEIIGGDISSPLTQAVIAHYVPAPTLTINLTSNPNVNYSVTNSNNVVIGTSGSIIIPKTNQNHVTITATPTSGNYLSSLVVGPDTIGNGIRTVPINPKSTTGSSISISSSTTTTNPKTSGPYEIIIFAYIVNNDKGIIPNSSHTIKDILETSDPDIDSGSEKNLFAQVRKSYSTPQDVDINISIDELLGPTGCNCYAILALRKDYVLETIDGGDWLHNYANEYSANGNQIGPYATEYTDVANLTSSNRRIIYNVILGRTVKDYDIDIEMDDGTTLPISYDYLKFEEHIEFKNQPSNNMLFDYIYHDERDVDDDAVGGNQHEYGMKVLCGNDIDITARPGNELQHYYYPKQLEIYGESTQTNPAMFFTYMDLSDPTITESSFSNADNNFNINIDDFCSDMKRTDNKQTVLTIGTPNVLFLTEVQHRYDYGGTDVYTNASLIPNPINLGEVNHEVYNPKEWVFMGNGCGIAREQITTGRHNFNVTDKVAVPRLKFNKKIELSEPIATNNIQIELKDSPTEKFARSVTQNDWSKYSYIPSDDKTTLIAPLAIEELSVPYLSEKASTFQLSFDVDALDNDINVLGNTSMTLAGKKLDYTITTELPIVKYNIELIEFHRDPDINKRPNPFNQVDIQLYLVTTMEHYSPYSYVSQPLALPQVNNGDGNGSEWASITGSVINTFHALPVENNQGPAPLSNRKYRMQIGYPQNPNLHVDIDPVIAQVDYEQVARDMFELVGDDIIGEPGQVFTTHTPQLNDVFFNVFAVDLDKGGFALYNSDLRDFRKKYNEYLVSQPYLTWKTADFIAPEYGRDLNLIAKDMEPYIDDPLFPADDDELIYPSNIDYDTGVMPFGEWLSKRTNFGLMDQDYLLDYPPFARVVISLEEIE
ncbi:MAG: hypothetical protein Kapaf2KO_23850 [Candidatus Kapaibacteriales bacterium]